MSYAHDVNTSLLFLERVGKIENIVRSSGFFLAKKYGRQNRSTHRTICILLAARYSRFLNSFQAQSDSHQRIARILKRAFPPRKEKGKVARPNDPLTVVFCLLAWPLPVVYSGGPFANRRGGDYNRAPPCLLSPRVFLARSIYPSPSSSLGNRAIDPCSLPKIFQVSNKFFRRSV